MKPQCNTSAECLRELARVMEQFGIKDTIDAVCSIYMRYNNGPWVVAHGNNMPTFANPEFFTFAIAEVEGKPVFIGDELYSIHDGRKVTDELYIKHNADSLSWNPPRPATVMVEMKIETAEYLARFTGRLDVQAEIANASKDCKTALESLKS